MQPIDVLYGIADEHCLGHSVKHRIKWYIDEGLDVQFNGKGFVALHPEHVSQIEILKNEGFTANEAEVIMRRHFSHYGSDSFNKLLLYLRKMTTRRKLLHKAWVGYCWGAGLDTDNSESGFTNQYKHGWIAPVSVRNTIKTGISDRYLDDYLSIWEGSENLYPAGPCKATLILASAYTNNGKEEKIMSQGWVGFTQFFLCDINSENICHAIDEIAFIAKENKNTWRLEQ